MSYGTLLTGVFERIAGCREERPSAGTKYRLMGLVADITEVAEALQREVLERVSHEAVVDADVDIDFAEMSEQVLTLELEECEGQSEEVREQTHLVNEALGVLSNILLQTAEQKRRRHKDEEYELLYENEKRRYMSSGTPRRVRQAFDEWLFDVCSGKPSMEDINDYITEKLVHMFEKGVFDTKVEHIQRAKRYPGEFNFDHLDDDHKLKKTVYKHYVALHKLVDFRDGYLVIDPVKVGCHFFTSRHEENAKAHRNAFMKYMHKIDLAQQERRKLQEAMQDAEESILLPDVLATGVAMKYWKRLQSAGFVDDSYQLAEGITRKQAMYIADVFSDKLQMRSKWKPFQDLWHINNLAQEKWEMQETGKTPNRSEDIDKIFVD